MSQILSTERLILRRFNQSDAPFILNLMNTPTWLKYIGDRNIKTVADAEKYLENGPVKSYQLNGFGLCMVALKATGLPIGMCGLIKRDGLAHADIGFALLPEFGGKGYGFEIASATLKYAKTALRLPTVVAITTINNHASKNLLLKLGMHFEKNIQLQPNQEEMLLFSINLN